MSRNSLKFVGGLLLGLALPIAILVAVFDWNWLRGPLETVVLKKTGRQLVITGDLKVNLGWPLAHVDIAQVAFANPAWATQMQMLVADDAAFTLELPTLFSDHIFLPEVRLVRPVIVLERGTDDRANWRLDREQQDRNSTIRMGALRLDQGRLTYDDARQKTSLRADISTAQAVEDAGLQFDVRGQFKGFALAARGNGGPAIAMSAESVPYPLKFEATLGRTWMKADGTITGVPGLSAIDMKFAVKGDSLAQLFPQFGMALPETHPYNLVGRLGHDDRMWRYENFSGHIGKSDIAGTLQVDEGEPRKFLHGELSSARLYFDDLGPVIGTRQAGKAPTSKRMLPTEPYVADHWSSLDAEVKFSATKIDRAQELPLDNLVTNIKLRNSVLMLDPLDFGVAGGHLDGKITLDGRQDPIRAVAKIQARKILLAKMFPTIKLTEKSIGQMNGQIDLAGTGNNVANMLATANGKAAFVVGEGQVSQLLMEQIGLHLPEILKLKISGDKVVAIRCGVADFGVKQGIMSARTLVLDTEVTTLHGTGTIDLAEETLDLKLTPKTKDTSFVALRTPIHVRGTFDSPDVGIDTMKVAARGLGAIALGVLNPLLAIIPLVEPGPGTDSDCGGLVRRATEPRVTVAETIEGSGRP